jgi:hypothetical protein
MTIGHALFAAALLVIATPARPSPAGAENPPGHTFDNVTYEDYQQGRSQVADHFLPIYKEFGAHVRRAQILKKCGYKREADALQVAIASLANKRLMAISEDAILRGKLRNPGAAFVAREGADSMLVGYGLGYEESFTLVSDLLPGRDYESLCKKMLRDTREWLEGPSW